MIRFVRYWILRLFGDSPDPAWRPQTPIVRFKSYDRALAETAWKRSQRPRVRRSPPARRPSRIR